MKCWSLLSLSVADSVSALLNGSGMRHSVRSCVAPPRRSVAFALSASSGLHGWFRCCTHLSNEKLKCDPLALAAFLCWAGQVAGRGGGCASSAPSGGLQLQLFTLPASTSSPSRGVFRLDEKAHPHVSTGGATSAAIRWQHADPPSESKFIQIIDMFRKKS